MRYKSNNKGQKPECVAKKQKRSRNQNWIIFTLYRFSKIINYRYCKFDFLKIIIRVRPDPSWQNLEAKFGSQHWQISLTKWTPVMTMSLIFLEDRLTVKWTYWTMGKVIDNLVRLKQCFRSGYVFDGLLDPDTGT